MAVGASPAVATTTESNGDAAPTSKSPYQLDLAQVEHACAVLLKNIQEETQRRDADAKPDLLAQDDDAPKGTATPVWLVVTTKKHIVDRPRLKPGKIALPHPLPSSTTGSICLITADPQRLYKEAIDSPAFPAALRSRIGRVIELPKLQKKYKTYEARRQLFAEHDVFLSDDRVVTYLPQTLGKVFYKTGAKRPIAVDISGPSQPKDNESTVKFSGLTPRKSTKGTVGRGAASPERIARELSKALQSTPVHLAPGVSSALRVADASFTTQMCTDNVAAAVESFIERFVPARWRNVRAVHIKGPNSVALPIWLASELWVDEADVLEDESKSTDTATKKKKTTESRTGASENAEGGVSLNAGSAGDATAAPKRKAGLREKPSTDDVTERHATKKMKIAAQRELLASKQAAERRGARKKQAAALLDEAVGA